MTLLTLRLGEFHFMMHFCHAVYRLGFHDYLEPVAKAFNLTTLCVDFKLRKWNKHDEFLLLFTEASCNWLSGMLSEMYDNRCNEILGMLPQNLRNAPYEDILNAVRHNKTVCLNLIFFYNTNIC